jgi:phospholipase/carboxylesterase
MRVDPAAVLWSTPERERAGRPLLVLLHGRGSHEGDLFGLGPQLPLGATIASVRAPIAEGPGFSWFAATTQTPGDVSGAAADEAASAVLDWLDGVDTSAGVGMLGFSQGAVVGAQALRLAPRRFDYLVALSGYVCREDHPGDARLRELPTPVFWGRGDADRVIPDASVEWSIPWFATHTLLTERVYPGLGHGVSPEELREISGFVAGRLTLGGP